MIDDDFVAPVGTEGCLDCLCNCTAGVDVTEDGAIFGIVAVAGRWLFGCTRECNKIMDAHFWYPCLKRPALGALGIESDISVRR